MQIVLKYIQVNFQIQLNLKKRLSTQKNIDVEFDFINNANHFYKGKEKELANSIDDYIKDKVTVIQF